MKNVKILTIAAVAGVLAISGFAWAQNRHTSMMGHGPIRTEAEGAAAIKRLADVFPTFVAFDANKDHNLDAQELQSLLKAIKEGTVQLPHPPPPEFNGNPQALLKHVGEMFGKIAKYDANNDGALDEAEQRVILNAIKSGELDCPLGQQGPSGAHH